MSTFSEIRAHRHAENLAKRLTKDGKKDVVTTTVKGDRQAAALVEAMIERGYAIQGQDSRKVVWSLTTGVFTRKQKHSFTFVRAEA